MGMKRSIDFPEELLERLKRFAENKGLTVSAVVKMACKELLDREEKK